MIHDHDLTPALEGDALKDIEQSPEDVVEVGYVIVRIERLFSTVVPFTALIRTTENLLALLVDLGVPSLDVHTSLLQEAHEEVEPADSKNEEEEEKHDDRVLQHRDGFHD